MYGFEIAPSTLYSVRTWSEERGLADLGHLGGDAATNNAA
jgi:hypothetical protein